jgi:hypothetical protein
MSSPEIGTSLCTTSCFDTNQLVPIFPAMSVTFLPSAAAHELVMAVVTKKIRCAPGKPPFLFVKRSICSNVLFCTGTIPIPVIAVARVASDHAEQVLGQRDDLVGVVCGVSVTVRSLRLSLILCLMSSCFFRGSWSTVSYSVA